MALSLAVCLKAYPVALGLLFVVIEPRRFGPRFAAAMVLALALPFAFQSPGYVAGQYQDWLVGGLNARYIPGAFQDVMYTWQRWIGPMDRSAFILISAVVGMAIGGVTFIRRRRMTVGDCVVSAFGMATAWMMAFGPASEGTTYILLAPAAAIAVLGNRTPGWRRWVSLTAYLILVAAQLQLLLPLGRPLHRIGAQPVAAVLLLGVFVAWRGERISVANSRPSKCNSSADPNDRSVAA
jgi:hypothetical protein